MNASLRIAFMGTPEFAVPALHRLIGAGFEVAAVYSQPARRAGRGKGLRKTPVHQAAEAYGIEVRTPASLKDEGAQAAFRALDLDAAVVVAYGLILPQPILQAPRLGCLNLHGSRLPRWRGAAPIQRAVMAGDGDTAATVMVMDEGLDTGAILLQHDITITPEMTAGDLLEQMANIGGDLLAEGLDGLASGTLSPQAQPEDGVTYAAKIDKAEARIDWRSPAAAVVRQIQGLSPLPGAWFEHDGGRIKILRARLAVGAGAPGTVLDEHLTVACGAGAISLVELQRAGKGAMAAVDFRRGAALPPGTVLD
jgi:methionyl-tRNA formyltransferase